MLYRQLDREPDGHFNDRIALLLIIKLVSLKTFAYLLGCANFYIQKSFY